jgi:pimeloyl-ACP methyl ester carboxylesterase
MSKQIKVDQAVVEYRTWGSGAPTIVMLHDGLGSVAQWRHTPAHIAERCRASVVAYNRPGHGRSQPVPQSRWPVDWMHDQATMLATLLDRLDLVDVLLVGHSDGASIALLCAAAEATARPQGPRTIRGVVALAPHSYVETVCVESITAMRADRRRTVRALTAFHADADALFDAWSGVWVSDDFGRWDIRPRLAAIDMPVWVVQGDADEYATDDQLWQTGAAVGEQAKAIHLPDLGHLLHHQDGETVVSIVADAYRQVFPAIG